MRSSGQPICSAGIATPVMIEIFLSLLNIFLAAYLIRRFFRRGPAFKAQIKVLFSPTFQVAQLREKVSSCGLLASFVAISDFELEDLGRATKEALYIFLLDDSQESRNFLAWLRDVYFDFRVSRDTYHNLNFAAVGKSEATEETAQCFCRMGAICCAPPSESFDALFRMLQLATAVSPVNFATDLRYTPPLESSSEEEQHQEDPIDLEDLGSLSSKIVSSKLKENPMVTATLERSLTKQGYHIVGTHSGVKICRWTKSMLRGRGGCYKHTFYGIASHRCMETTPSLACANKCVFCWRHHSNPVATEWRWRIDAPEQILEGAMAGHHAMLKQMRGVPGVDANRFAEAQTIKHCALSLVGEPIMYPKINDLLNLLHGRRISTFLVTNAQFPDRMEQLIPVTQLYVSVDAATKDSLAKIDRPLFKDFWERYLACLESIKRKEQRTVYRLTLVRDYNVENIDEYARLILLGRPDFVEVKGVTYCGYASVGAAAGAEATSQPLTMQNVPFHHEVARFCKDLSEALQRAGCSEYSIACEHEHSCSVLIADRKFYFDDRWHTWIDYERFHDLVAAGKHFTSLDYAAETPSWAVAGAAEHGFDPTEVRYLRKKATTETEAKIDHGC